MGELIQVTRAEGDPAGLATEPLRLDDLVRVIWTTSTSRPNGTASALEPTRAKRDEGNPELLRRAIENIVRNAIRYSPEGGKVDVRLERVRHALRSRCGTRLRVPPEPLAHIFDPFYRVEKDRGRTSGGVGLGWRSRSAQVELHHGQMRAIEREHPGLLVEIELPSPRRCQSSRNRRFTS